MDYETDPETNGRNYPGQKAVNTRLLDVPESGGSNRTDVHANPF